MLGRRNTLLLILTPAAAGNGGGGVYSVYPVAARKGVNEEAWRCTVRAGVESVTLVSAGDKTAGSTAIA